MRYRLDLTLRQSEGALTRVLGNASLLRDGTNVLAVELHQCNAGSSDLYFDLALTALVDPLQVVTRRAGVTVGLFMDF